MTATAPAMQLESVTLRPAANGGVIVTCAKKGQARRGDSPGAYESKDYAFTDVAQALRYAASELGDGQPGTQSQGPGPEAGPVDEVMGEA